MDYDATNIAAGYDRGRSHGPEYLELWMSTVSAYIEGQKLDGGVLISVPRAVASAPNRVYSIQARSLPLAVPKLGHHQLDTILDLGCGTGRFSEALAARFDAEVIGVDPSTKMLEQAKRKQLDKRVRYQLGHGEAIPLPDKSVDLIFMSMVFHHFDNPRLAGRECRRVLRDEGTLFMRAGTRERIPSYPYVDYFPTSVPILEQYLCEGTMVRETFEAAGFRSRAVEVITQQIAPSLERYAEKLAAGADSVLASLGPSDFEAGMEALRSHAARADRQAVFEPIDVFVFR